MSEFFRWLKTEWWFIPGFVLAAVLVLITLFATLFRGLNYEGIGAFLILLSPAFIGFFLLNSFVYLVRYLVGLSEKKYEAKDWFIITWAGFLLAIILSYVAEGVEGLATGAIGFVIFPGVMIMYFFQYFFNAGENAPLMVSSFALSFLLPLAWFFMEYFKDRLNTPWQVWLRRGILILLFFLLAFGTYGCVKTPFTF